MPIVFNSSKYDEVPHRRTSFSGADIRAIVHRPHYLTDGGNGDVYPNSGAVYHTLGSVQTISISNYRDKREVRALGHQHPLGYARGSRTIAGTLVFALLDTHPFNDDSDGIGGDVGNGILRSSSGAIDIDHDFTDEFEPLVNVNINRRHQYDFTWDSQTFGQLMYADELPPFDIIVTFVNEAGGIGQLVLFGVDLHHEGQTLSIEDLFTEVTYSYTARGMKMFQEGSYEGRLWAGSPSAQEADYALSSLTNGRGTLQ